MLTFIFTVSQQGIAQGLIAQIAAFKASGDIAGPAATSLSAQINAAGGLASVNPAAAQHLLSVISNRLVSLASRGQVSAAARDTLILQITLWSAAL